MFGRKQSFLDNKGQVSFSVGQRLRARKLTPESNDLMLLVVQKIRVLTSEVVCLTSIVTSGYRFSTPDYEFIELACGDDKLKLEAHVKVGLRVVILIRGDINAALSDFGGSRLKFR